MRLVPGRDPSAVAASVLDLLSNASALKDQARLDAMAWDHNVMWPRFQNLFQQLVNS